MTRRNSTAMMEEPTVRATQDWVDQGTIRAELEAAELRTLAPWAGRSAHSAGRAQPEPEDPVRTCWMRDLDRITFSRAMLRAHGKTQSFIPAFSGEGPAGGSHGGPFIGDHYVTRATHVQQTARTAEVLDGIGHHSWRLEAPSTLEGTCVRLADRIAYLTADLADSLRAGVLGGLGDLPADVRRALGETPSDMIGTLVEDVIRHSRGQPLVVQGERCAEAMTVLRGFMFERVYLRPEADGQTQRAKRLLTDLYGYYLEHPEAMPMGASLDGDPVEQQAIDAIAGMTDRYALAAWKSAFAPDL